MSAVDEFLSHKPTLIGRVGGVPFYEHPILGDEHPMLAIIDGRLVNTQEYDLPHADVMEADYYETLAWSDGPAKATASGDVIHDILVETRAILDAPGHWTKDRNAEDKDGNEVAPAEAAACAWCLQGALMLASVRQGVALYSETYDTAKGILNKAAASWMTARARTPWPTVSVVDFNDHDQTTHDDVRGLLDDVVNARREA